ncbi:DNA modification system-associated small protein [Paenibacillus aurantiacus]|uniref:DNA modification system-associated small protein n=1 Tax=Paenibacillus aurantiacus TaxID=1936118 RepID=A0ABV5KGQ2_9BACL
MTTIIQDEDDLLVEICNKHGVDPQYLRELFMIEKEYADKNMARRRGIYERITECIETWVEEEEAGINVL